MQDEAARAAGERAAAQNGRPSGRCRARGRGRPAVERRPSIPNRRAGQGSRAAVVEGSARPRRADGSSAGGEGADEDVPRALAEPRDRPVAHGRQAQQGDAATVSVAAARCTPRQPRDPRTGTACRDAARSTPQLVAGCVRVGDDDVVDAEVARTPRAGPRARGRGRRPGAYAAVRLDEAQRVQSVPPGCRRRDVTSSRTTGRTRRRPCGDTTLARAYPRGRRRRRGRRRAAEDRQRGVSRAQSTGEAAGAQDSATCRNVTARRAASRR